MPTTILIVDDEANLVELVQGYLEQEGFAVLVAADGLRALDLARTHHPDVVVLDIMLPGLDGVDAIYAVRDCDPNARIVVLTTFDGDEDIYRGMRAGAKSYLLKDVRREELFQCIREVHAGRTFVPPAIAAKLAERLPAEELTPREREVLRLLAEGKPNKLIGAALSISEVTVKSHVQAVFRKLNVLSRTEAIAIANRKGLLHL